VLVSVLISMNISNQYKTLLEAKKQNYEIEKKISKLDEENQILNQKIAYATSGAFLEQEVRDKLGLGTEKDIWLDVGEEKDLNLFPKINEAKNIPNIKQWINLFTR
jgi:hypothetical protein